MFQAGKLAYPCKQQLNYWISRDSFDLRLGLTVRAALLQSRADRMWEHLVVVQMFHGFVLCVSAALMRQRAEVLGEMHTGATELALRNSKVEKELSEC